MPLSPERWEGIARQREDHILGKESHAGRGLQAEEKMGHAGRDSNWFCGVTMVQPERERSVSMRLCGRSPLRLQPSGCKRRRWPSGSRGGR